MLGHAHLSTTQLYVTPMPGDVIAGVLAHHRRMDPAAAGVVDAPPPEPLIAYRQDSLDVLFGGRR